METNNDVFKKARICKKCENIEFIGKEDYPYCYEMFKLGWGIRKVPLDSVSDLCPLIEIQHG